jgi:FMN phosphatase YigB (HAD superfamily)
VSAERPIEAVVFDLDDTLFDTYGQCVLAAHHEAARAMVAAGLRATEDAVVLRRLRLTGIDEDLDAAVSRMFPCDDPAGAAEAGRRAFYDRDPGPVTPFPYVRDVLKEVRRRARCVLLSTGHPSTQRRKVETLGIGDLFDEVLLDDVFGRGSKRRLIEDFLRRSGFAPPEVLVVGDRPGSEIRAALDLGCRALRIRRGEFAEVPTPAGVPEAADVRAVLPYLAAC